MGDFFHGWRRKWGCGALILALVFTGGWVRSHTVHDELVIPIGKSSAVQIVSAARCLGVMTIRISGSGTGAMSFSWQSKPCLANRTELRIETRSPDLQQAVKRRLQSVIEFNDVHWDQYQIGMDGISATYYHIPYWWIILPVTVLAACLLLSQPRKPKSVPPPRLPSTDSAAQVRVKSDTHLGGATNAESNHFHKSPVPANQP